MAQGREPSPKLKKKFIYFVHFLYTKASIGFVERNCGHGPSETGKSNGLRFSIMAISQNAIFNIHEKNNKTATKKIFVKCVSRMCLLSLINSISIF